LKCQASRWAERKVLRRAKRRKRRAETCELFAAAKVVKRLEIGDERIKIFTFYALFYHFILCRTSICGRNGAIAEAHGHGVLGARHEVGGEIDLPLVERGAHVALGEHDGIVLDGDTPALRVAVGHGDAVHGSREVPRGVILTDGGGDGLREEVGGVVLDDADVLQHGGAPGVADVGEVAERARGIGELYGQLIALGRDVGGVGIAAERPSAVSAGECRGQRVIRGLFFFLTFAAADDEASDEKHGQGHEEGSFVHCVVELKVYNYLRLQR